MLQGEAAFEYRREAPRPARGKTRAAVANMPAGDPALLAALKAVRLVLARERQVPAFVIFSDRTLIDMAERCPRSLAEFAGVHGVGAVKLKEFGALFLAAIAKHAA